MLARFISTEKRNSTQSAEQSLPVTPHNAPAAETLAIHRRAPTLLATLFILLAFGQLMLLSATAIEAKAQLGSAFYFSSRQLAAAAVGLLLMYGLSLLPLRFYRRLSLIGILLQLLLVCLTYVAPFGHRAQGAARWISLGGLPLQPSAFAKLTVIFYLASLLSSPPQSQNKPWQKTVLHWLMALLPLFMVLAAIYAEPDLGTTILLTTVIGALFFVWGMPLKPLLASACLASFFFSVAICRAPYRWHRLTAFLHPFSDPHGTGYQSIQSMVFLHEGAWAGVGIGNGNSKVWSLPQIHTDFIFALIGEEWGLVGSLAVLIAYFVLLHQIGKSAFASRDTFARLVGTGLTVALAFEIFIPLYGVVGLLPVKGLPLPFIAWGRSAIISDLCLMGIVLQLVRPRERTS